MLEEVIFVLNTRSNNCTNLNDVVRVLTIGCYCSHHWSYAQVWKLPQAQGRYKFFVIRKNFESKNAER